MAELLSIKLKEYQSTIKINLVHCLNCTSFLIHKFTASILIIRYTINKIDSRYLIDSSLLIKIIFQYNNQPLISSS